MLWFDDRATTAALLVRYYRGTAGDPSGRLGEMHLLEHLLMSQDGQRDEPGPVECVELGGGYANAETRLDSLTFYAQSGPDRVADLVAFARSILSPVLGGRSADAERVAILAEIRGIVDDPYERIQDDINRALGGERCWAVDVAGSPDDVALLTPDGLADAHRQRLGPLQPFVAYAGPPADLPPELMVAATPAVASLEAGPRRPVLTGPTTSGNTVGPGTVWACLGGEHRRAPLAAHAVLAQLLGGSPVGLLYPVLRERLGISYHFEAWSRRYQVVPGLTKCLVAVDGPDVDSATEAIEKVLQEIAGADLAEDRFLAARRRAVFAVRCNLESTLGAVRAMSDAWLVGEDPRPGWELRLFDVVSTDDVALAAQDVLTTAVWTFAA